MKYVISYPAGLYLIRAADHFSIFRKNLRSKLNLQSFYVDFYL